MNGYRTLKKSKLRDLQAFSLMEILLALAIISIIMTTLYSTFSNSLSIIKNSTEIALDSRRRMILYRIIESDIQNTFYPKEWKRHFFRAKKKFIGDSNKDELQFITLSTGLSRISKVGDLREIGYFVKESGQTQYGNPVFNLYRREQIGLDEFPEKGGWISQIAKGVLSLTIECTASLGKQLRWQRSWDYKRFQRYPRGVRITVRFQSKNDPDAYNDLIIIGEIRQQRPKKR